MTDPSAHPDCDSEQPRVSWKEKELLAALRRVAMARSQVSLLEHQLETQTGSATIDPDDVERVEQMQAELERLAHKSHAHFGAAAARERLSELETDQRLVLERLGFASYEAFREWKAAPPDEADAIDPAFVEFAQRELASAEAAYQQILELPDDEPAAPEVSDQPPPVDLTHP